MPNDADIRNTPGVDSAMGNYSAMTKSFQTLASEMQRMSKEAVESTTQVMERLRDAKSMEDVVAIQTKFMQQSFSHYADFTRRFSELMVSVPMEMAKNGRAAFQQGTDAVSKAAEQAGEQIQRTGDQFNQHG